MADFIALDLPDLILFIAVACFALLDRKLHSYPKGLLLTSAVLALFNRVILLALFRFQLFPQALEYGSFAYRVRSNWSAAAGNLSYALLLFAVCLLLGKTLEQRTGEEKAPSMTGSRRSIGLSLLLFVVTLGVYYPFWLYRTVRDLKENFDSEIPYSPGSAVGFLFIPLFNIYWSIRLLFSLPLCIQRIETAHFGRTVGFHFHAVLIPILNLAFIAVSWTVYANPEGFLGIAIYGFFSNIVLYLTIQAKLNAFFEAASETSLAAAH